MAVTEQSRSLARSSTEGWLATLNVETGLYIAIGLLALTLRFANLGEPPFSSLEAREALAVWRFVNASESAPIQPVSAAWFTLTALTFSLFSGNEFWARFWPMIAGEALVFAPLFFRRELGRGAALIACALLAISPVMLAASRTADGATLAAASLLLIAIGLRKISNNTTLGITLTGLGLGLGLAAGPRLVSGAAAALLMMGTVVLVRPEAARALRRGWAAVQPFAWHILAVAGVVLVFVASAGFVNPPGLSAAGAALPRWIASWQITPAMRPAWLVPQMIAVYEPLLTAFGIGGLYVAFLSGLWQAVASRVQNIFAVRESELQAAFAGGGAANFDWRGTASGLSAAAIGGLLFGILYLGREASDAVWVVLPLAALSGKVLAETFSGEWFEGEWETVLAQAGVLFVMFAFLYFQVAGYARGYALFAECPAIFQRIIAGPDCAVTAHLYLAGGVLTLGIFVTVMFALGWSQLSAVRGAVLALSVATTIATLGAGLGLTQWRPTDPNELWVTTPSSDNLRLMMKSIRDISQRTTGKVEDIEIAVMADPTLNEGDGLLGWELREFPNAHFVDSLALAKNSPIVLTSSVVSEPELGSAYVGESYGAQSHSVSADLTLQNLLNWWMYRTWPSEFSRRVDMWTRVDIHNLSQK